ncbi:MAG: zinc ribbon domain-containing protein [Christensenella sp.]|nr:zinc ribbon domain-containing protein [Christensenella sp.]
MERRAQPKKRYQSASFVTSGAVFYGALLFLIARVFTLLQLFSDAYTRNKLDQAPPENFTFFGILSSVVIIAVIGFAFYLLVQNRGRRLRMKPGNLYLLLNALFAVWGIISAISYLVEMILFFEFVYLLDFVTLLAALVVPCVLYQLSDRNQTIPPDNALFAAAIASTSLSVIATLIVALVLRKSYTTLQLVRELMFRAGIILFGIAGLLKAIRLRAELPELVATMPKPAPKPISSIGSSKKAAPKKASFGDRIKCPDCGKKLSPDTKICPRCGFDIETPDLFDDEDEAFDFDEADGDLLDGEGYDDEPVEEYDDWQEPPAEPAPPVRQELPKDICPRCNRKKPPFLSTCPHCGYYPGDPIELAEQEAERQRQAAAQADAEQPGASGYTPPPPRQEPKCEKCGKKIPGGLATCPYCGHHPDDDRMPPPKPKQDTVETLFEPEEELEYIFCPRCDNEVVKGTEVCPHCGYPFPEKRYTERIQRPTQRLPRVPDPKHLNEKNSIECPECGRRYSAARDRCPVCGYGLYDD